MTNDEIHTFPVPVVRVDARTALLRQLRELATMTDRECARSLADVALLLYIADPEVTEAFAAIEKWYA